MDAQAPLIFAPTNLPAADPGPHVRIFGLLTALGCLAILLIAASLTPSHSGMGTHTHLGLQKCAFLERTGIPCPSCGMTTSFTWFAHGNIAASFYVQPMGAILAIICCCCVSAGLYIALTGRPIHRLLRLLPSRYTFWPLIVVAILAWGWKIYLHLSGHDGW